MTNYETWNLFIMGVTGAAIVATFVVYSRQLKAMRDASSAQSLLTLVNILQTNEVRAARKVVRDKLRTLSFGEWEKKDEDAAALVCSTYDVAGIIIRLKLVPAAPFVQNWGASIKTCREALEVYLNEMRKPENSGENYWPDFDRLYAMVMESHRVGKRSQPGEPPQR